MKYIIWVYVALGVLLVGMIALVALDDANAQYYIDAFQTLLSWPVLAFSLVMIVLLIFHSDLANVFKGYYISRVGRDAVHFEPKPQPEPPAGERPILPADDQPAPQPAPAITDNDAYLRGYDDGWQLGLASANEQVETWEQEANHWWHRYLTIFLTPETQGVLKSIASRPGGEMSLTEISKTANSRLLGVILLPPILNALDVLAKYDLIQREGGGLSVVCRITDDGRAFLRFVDSPEGQEFVREAFGEQHAGHA